MVISIKSVIKKIVSSPMLTIAASIGCPLAAMLIMLAISFHYNINNIWGYGTDDVGGDTARAIVSIATGLSGLLSAMAGLKIIARDGGQSSLNIAKGLGIALGAPLTVHLIGTVILNLYLLRL